MNSDEQKILEKLKEARNLYLQDDFSQAIGIYQELCDLLKDDPQNLPVVQIELGWSYYQNQEYQNTIEQLQRAVNSQFLTPKQQFDCLRLIGFSYEMLKDHERARAFLEDAISVDIPEKEKRHAYFELGKVLFTLGEIIEAEHYFNLADSLFKNNEKNYKLSITYFLGFTALLQKNFREARDRFDSIIQQSEDIKDQVSGYFGLTHIHYYKKDYQALLDLCEKILRLDSNFFDKESLGYFMCFAYLHLQKWEELEMFFNELENNYPTGRYVSEYPKFRQAIKERKIPEDNSN